MKPCPNVHQYPFFVKSYDSQDKLQERYKKRLEDFLKNGAAAGEKKGHGLNPLYGFPTGKKVPVRVIYVFCRDCRKELFISKCSFCETAEHTMDDAVLFEIDSDHDSAYEKAEKNLKAVKNPEYKHQ